MLEMDQSLGNLVIANSRIVVQVLTVIISRGDAIS